MGQKPLTWWDHPGLLDALSPRNLTILGATGSIGRSVRDIIRRFKDHFRVFALVARRNIKEILAWMDVCTPRHILVTDRHAAEELRQRVSPATEVHHDASVLLHLVSAPEVDTVVSAIVGAAGLKPTYEALRRGKRVCLANKESLVIGGPIIQKIIRENRGCLIPVDSEHSALFQVTLGEDRETIERLWLTASGGPFLNRPLETFDRITPEEALQHPNWSMGPKITIDSATLLNKGLELIEAHYMFDWPEDRIEVVIHPQSIIHSMVEFIDGSFKAQLSIPDMRLPILYALAYPRRLPLHIRSWTPWETPKLEFFRPDERRFPCLALARQAVRQGPTYPIVLNAANEVAVQAFLDGLIRFTDIPHVIEEAMTHHRPRPLETLDDITDIDKETREFAHQWTMRNQR